MMFGFAALQWNDPDRLQWISVYFATSFLAILIFIKLCNTCAKAWAIMLSTICLIMMTQTFTGVFEYLQTSNYSDIYLPMTDDKPHIEEVREFLGLLIVLLYCITSTIILFKNRLN